MISFETTKIDSNTISYGFSQIIFDPTHILLSSSLCIGLNFTNQLNLVNESGIHPSLHPKRDHQIEQLPLYEGLI